MADPTGGTTQNMEGTTSTTITIDTTDAQTQEDTVQLKLRKASGDRKVKWSTETVDNEHMDKKKSKCCCIYKKPRPFGESSSEDESDDDHGHCDHHNKSKEDKPANEDQLESTPPE